MPTGGRAKGNKTASGVAIKRDKEQEMEEEEKERWISCSAILRHYEARNEF